MDYLQDYDRICDTGHLDFIEDRPSNYRQYTDKFASWVYALGREEAIWMIVAKCSGPKLSA